MTREKARAELADAFAKAGVATAVKTFTCGHTKTVLASVDASRPCNSCRLAAEEAAYAARPISRRATWPPRIAAAERDLPPYDEQEDCRLACYRDSLRYGGESMVDSDSYYEGAE